MSNWFYYDFINASETMKRSLIKGDLGEFRYIKDIINTRIGMFTYENLPDSLTSQIIETALMFRTNLCFYKCEGMDELVLCNYVSASDFNYYMKPNKVNLITFNGVTIANNVDFKDIVLVRDNTLDIIPFICISEYIQKIMELEEDLMQVTNNATLPLAIVGSKKQANQLNAIADSLDSRTKKKKRFIIGDDTLVGEVKGFPINVPISPLDIYDLKSKYKNECMSSLGIYAVDSKRERIVTQELVNQNDYTDFIYMNAKMERERAIKEANEKWGYNIKLVETYTKNFEETAEDKAEASATIIGAQAEALKEVNPEGNTGGGPKPSMTYAK